MTKKAYIALAMFLFAVVVAKAIMVFASEVYFHKYKVLAAQVRDHKRSLLPFEQTEQALWLSRAMRFAPYNGNILFETGRLYHRAALRFDLNTAQALCEKTGIAKARCNPAGFLEIAMNAYAQAHRENRLNTRAVFWNLVAHASYRDLFPEQAQEKWGPFDDAAFRSDLSDALFEGNATPAMLREGGELATRFGDIDLAERCFKLALLRSLDGMERMVEVALTWPDGHDRVLDLPPQNPEALRRLSDALVDAWHFDLAREAWLRGGFDPDDTAGALYSGNHLRNGDFRDPLGNHFLGWHVEDFRGVRLSRTEPSGLMVQVNQEIDHYFHLKQPIPVEMETTYRFEGRLKLGKGAGLLGGKISIEVVHPFDVTIWSRSDDCLVYSQKRNMACRGKETDDQGFVHLQFDFSPPIPLRMVWLRLVISGEHLRGSFVINNFSIRPLPPEKPEGATDSNSENEKQI